MPNNTGNRGYTYPTLADSNDVPFYMQTLAEQVDADVSGLMGRDRFVSGTSIVTINASGNATISWGSGVFTSAVRSVVCSLGDTASAVGTVNVTGFNGANLNGFTVLALNRSGAALTSGNIRVNWIATGR